ncbi:hypothetical protein AVEN_69869-1 [Araneus ventricosus]|uniref:Uncharacterized protein n=1 Tax=Araneus ventricosus TaxID=182803 RepID=A0A4Y2HEX9_ARAVE|nr:hypothetical protein AVEN_69869-1 [Araneus ventricosus]
MGLLKVGSLLLLCLFSVSATEDGKSPNNVEKEATDIEAQPSTNLETQIDQKPIAKASKVSEFYIGDLLRTSDKELDTASTVYNPVSSTPEYNHRALTPEDPRLFVSYKSHGAQIYAPEEILLPFMQPERLQNPIKVADAAPLGAYEKATVQQPGVLGRNAMAAEAEIPALRRYEPSHGPHKGADCKKHLHSSPASSEEGYASDERFSYKQGRAPHAPPPPTEYRSPGGYQDDSSEESPGYSQSYPSRSKSYASEHDSDTHSDSKSGKSYTTSKSSSTSKTVNPNSKRGKVYVFDTRKPAKQGHSSSSSQGSRSRSKSKSRPSHDSEEAPPTYHSTPEREPQSQYYQSYDSEAPSRPSHPSHAPSRYQKQHYSEQPPAEHYERGNYRGSKAPRGTSYSKEGYSNPEAPLRERQPSIPPKYNSNENVREPSPGPYRNPEEAYVADQPTHHRGENRYYDTPRQPEAQYYQQEQPITSPRPGKGRQHTSYDAYSPENAPVRGEAPYDRNAPAPRPPVSKRPEYAHEASPYSNGESSENYPRSRKPAGRSERSSANYYQPAQAEMRAQGPEVAAEHTPRALISKESIPQQSRSVSYSESSYNMGEPVSPKPKEASLQPAKVQARMYEEPQKMVNPLLSRERDSGYDAPYRPFNSEHPAGYGGDRYHEEPDSGERDYRPQPYEKPLQPYEDADDEAAGYDHADDGKPKGEVVGYADKYESHEPLELDDDFFRKYEISKNAKIIVATAMNPNLFVADGTGVAEGGSSDDDESYERRSQDPKEEVEPEIIRPKQQLFEAPQEAPESFSQLIDTNPRFLRKLSKSRRPEIGEFEEYDPSLDELVFRSGVGDPKAFVKSKGAKEIVQHHGDGVSKIIFNSNGRQRHSASENKEAYLPRSEVQDGEKLESAKSEKVEKVVEPEENKDRTV